MLRLLVFCFPKGLRIPPEGVEPPTNAEEPWASAIATVLTRELPWRPLACAQTQTVHVIQRRVRPLLLLLLVPSLQGGAKRLADSGILPIRFFRRVITSVFTSDRSAGTAFRTVCTCRSGKKKSSLTSQQSESGRLWWSKCAVKGLLFQQVQVLSR
jgi:hypothetical protein